MYQRFRTSLLGIRLFSGRGGGGRNWVGKKHHPVECSPEKLTEISAELKAEARRLGLSLVGVTSPRASSRFDKYKEWLAKNYNGELDYMEREDRVARRRDPMMILPGAQSVIMVGMHYWPGTSGFPKSHDPKLHGIRTSDPEKADTRGVVSSYAWGRDYHDILQKRVKALGRHLNEVAGGVGRFYVDTGAILERDFAERAGLGFVGKNTLLINARSGSGFFIGELFTTVKLPLDGDEDRGTRVQKKGQPGCGKCQRCRVACPTGAIVEDFVVDARKCISYLTIELKGKIPEELREPMGNRIYGCDICQQVCPWNRMEWAEANKDGDAQEASSAFSPLFGRPDEEVTTPRLGELLRLDDDGFRQRFAGSAVKRIGRERMARNAAVALGNAGGESDVAVLEEACLHETSAMVREHMRWAIARIKNRNEGKTDRRKREQMM